MRATVELEPGDTFASRYHVQLRLGEGDRKCTYLARDTKMDRDVALAIVRPEAALADPDGTRREVRMLGIIGGHDNVVSLYEMDVLDGCQFMVFEYLSGGTLGRYVEDQSGLGEMIPAKDVLRIGRQLCRGLAHLHHKGVLHRDLTLDNVWLDERGIAHLGDFDSAITIGDTANARPITTQSSASPEEREGRELDERSDLFSLGVVLHLLATCPDMPVDPTSPIPRRDDLPSSFDDLLGSLLAADHAARPVSAEATLAWLVDIGYASNVDALIARGEGETVEFKSSLLHPYGEFPPEATSDRDAMKKNLKGELQRSVAKTVAAFLNTLGGTLLIGVDDAGLVLGIEADFAELDPSTHDAPPADRWQLKLKTAITNALGPEVWDCVRVSLVRDPRGTVAVVACPPRSTETWITAGKSDKTEEFYVRTGPSVQLLSPREASRYSRQHWS